MPSARAARWRSLAVGRVRCDAPVASTTSASLASRDRRRSHHLDYLSARREHPIPRTSFSTFSVRGRSPMRRYVPFALAGRVLGPGPRLDAARSFGWFDFDDPWVVRFRCADQLQVAGLGVHGVGRRRRRAFRNVCENFARRKFGSFLSQRRRAQPASASRTRSARGAGRSSPPHPPSGAAARGVSCVQTTAAARSRHRLGGHCREVAPNRRPVPGPAATARRPGTSSRFTVEPMPSPEDLGRSGC